MKEFDIEITETLKRKVTVEANTQEEAEELVYDDWSKGIHVLDESDFVGEKLETVAEREIVLKVLLVEPMKTPKEVEIPDSLKELQNAVGGYIEVLNAFDDPVVIVCNEEGKINGLELNRGIYDDQGELAEVIAGTFLILGNGEDGFTSLSTEMKEKYTKEFEKPERFYKLAGKIIAQKVEPQKEKNKLEKNKLMKEER